MSVLLKTASILVAFITLAGCSAWPETGNNGAFYTKVSSPVVALPNDRSEPLRYGQACNSSLLGLYAAGDSSLAAAMQKASITEVVTVEEEFKHVLLGAYAQYCTVVGGY